MASTVSGDSALLQRLQNTDPYEFEEFVADLWEDRGWETEVSQSSNDLGVDVIAEKSDGIVAQKQVIQVKRYNSTNKIGRPEVQKYHALKEQDTSADAAVIVTTSEFTTTAEEWAEDNNVKLIDGADLVDLIHDRKRYDLVDKYAPTIESRDASAGKDGGVSVDPVDESAIEPPSEEDLPKPFNDEETRKQIAAGLGVVGVVFLLNPTGITAPVELLGAVGLIAGIGVYAAPTQIYDAITPDRVVHRELPNGGEIVEVGDTVEYKPPGDRDARSFDTHNEARQRRAQAHVYGAIECDTGAPLEEIQAGVPTDIASSGERRIAAYRFAVHGEEPSTIAGEMSLTQEQIVDHMEETVQKTA